MYPAVEPTARARRCGRRVRRRRADRVALLAPEGSTLVLDPDAGARRALVATLRDDGPRGASRSASEHADAERTAAWDRARAGACVVVGGRTAVWAPVPDLAAVVVLDEGDEALEDERAPTWNARDVALERARRAGAPVRMVTPAPTVDALVAVGAPTPTRRSTRALAAASRSSTARRAARPRAADARRWPTRCATPSDAARARSAC